ncbi:MAG: tRNA pseudouridine(38-40) synthase TruA [Opitutales bacterium]|jgi:tRNA pseudouridine38-40 synthase
MFKGEKAVGKEKTGTRWRATCAYDGGDFLGWQSQKGGGTVQDFLEKRLGEIFERPVRVHGSGRTDAGVHARAQVFHFDAEWGHPVESLRRALRTGLPRGVQVTSVRRARGDFHARYSAKGKRYRYRIFLGEASPFESRYCWSLGKRKLEVEAMRAGAKLLVGKHDFSAYAGRLDEGEDPVKELRRLEVKKRGRRVEVVLEGSGFLYKMARGLTGALVGAGLGKLTPEDLARMLQERRRTHVVETAPAQGLCLERVFY